MLSRAPRLRWLAVGGALAAALVGAFAWLAFADGGRLPQRVTVGSVQVGGLSPEAAERRVRADARRLSGRTVTVSLPGEDLRIPAGRLGAVPDVEGAIEAAREARGAFGRALARIGLAREKRIAVELRADPRITASLAAELALKHDREARSAEIESTRQGLTLHPAAPGSRLDQGLLRRRLATAPPRVVAPFRTVPPAISTAAARRALTQAVRVTTGPLVVTAAGRSTAVSPTVVQRALRLTPGAGRIAVALDPAVLKRPLRRGLRGLEQPARSARFRITGDRVAIVPSQPGRQLDVEAVAAAAVARIPAPVPARFRTLKPERTTAEAEGLRIVELVGSFTTEYPCCQPRVTNIRRGAEILDGRIIPAGGRLSLNEALGQRTSERGFVPAPMILSGRLVDSVGGGVSQIATTLFNAAFFAGLDLLDHTPHEFYISRYPTGREATVSWRVPDLVIGNPWPAAVLVDAKTDDTSITIRLFSSKLGRRVEEETGSRYAPRPFREIVEVDKTLKPGERKVVQEGGGDGFSINYVRRIYRGAKLVKEEEFTTRYRPSNRIVAEGPKPKKPKKPKKGAAKAGGKAPGAAPGDTAPTDTTPTDTAPTDTAPTDTAPTDTAPTSAAQAGDAANRSATTVPGAAGSTTSSPPSR